MLRRRVNPAHATPPTPRPRERDRRSTGTRLTELRLRPYFRYERALLRDLAGCAWRVLRLWVLARV